MSSHSSNFESFEAVSGRLRVIASCDHCRTRKIKCTTAQAGQAKCDACTRLGAECTYNARNKFHSDRERVVASRIAAGSGGVATTSAPLGGQSSIISFSPAASTLPAANSQIQAPSPNPSFPPVALMPYFIELFFKHNSMSLPFMSYEGVVAGYLQSTLSAIASNGIACLASRYSHEMRELISVDPATAPEYYADQTKKLLRELINFPSIDVLSGLVLVAFHEHSSGRMDGLTYYAQQSANMAQTMGLYNDDTVTRMSQSIYEYQQIVSLRDMVSQLYQLVTAK